MLSHLAVQDLAVVHNVELELAPGVTALTGETGAGKSIIIDALELVIGARANADMVRAGASAAHVTAIFEPSRAVNEWLEEQALNDDDGACVLRRVIGADGRSRAFINSRAVAVSQLRALGERLVDVHGQHAHQALLKGAAQRQLLDTFLTDQTELMAVASAYEDLLRLDGEIAALGGGADPLDRLDFLRFQLDELQRAPVSAQELDEIEKEHRTLAHAAEILAAVASTRTALEDEANGSSSQLAAAIHTLDSAAAIDERLQGLHQSLRECASLLTETQSGLRRYAEGLEADDVRLGELDATLALIHDLARKHRVSDRALEQRRQELADECRQMENASARLEEAVKERDEAGARFAGHARRLHQLRCDAAARLVVEVNQILTTLGMEGAAIEFEVLHSDDAAPARHGQDRVSLLARTNPGQNPLPLARIASGGELSRIALAINAVAVNEGAAGTVVFDEVDAGVGGAVAEILGRQIRELGERRQVLTVTHLPQVAAFAHHHAVVRKHSDDTGTHSQLAALDRDQREQELARMLGGVTVTAATLAHAREMLRSVKSSRRRRRRSP